MLNHLKVVNIWPNDSYSLESAKETSQKTQNITQPKSAKNIARQKSWKAKREAS